MVKGRDKRRRSALKSGIRSAIGQCPPGGAYVHRLVLAFRKALEDEVIAAKGSIGLADACAIATAARWERHALLVTRWLRVGFAELTYDQRLAYSRDIGKASESRDRAIASLQLDKNPTTVIEALYASPRPPHDSAEQS